MGRRSSALVAGAVLVGCAGPDPEAPDASPESLLRPVTADFSIDISGACTQIGPYEWSCEDGSNVLATAVITVNSEPVTEGAITWQMCVDVDDNWVSENACEVGDARWVSLAARQPVSAQLSFQAFVPDGQGIRFTYSGRGSGVKRGASLGVDVRAVPPDTGA